MARLLGWCGASAMLPWLFPAGSRAAVTPGYGIDTRTTMAGGPPDRTRGELFEEYVQTSFRIVPDPQAATPRIIPATPTAPHPQAAHLPQAASRTAHDPHANALQLVPDPQTAPRMVVLASVTQSQTTIQPGRKGPPPSPRYSLIFRDASRTPLPQETYRIEHAHLGVFPMFLVPIGPKGGEATYQAIFA